MADNETTIEALIERAEAYSTSTIELVKLSTVAKSADIVSSLVTKLAVFLTIAMALLILSIGLSLWIGDMLGAAFYGFFIIGGFYVLLTILLFVFGHRWIKIPVSNAVIKQMLKP